MGVTFRFETDASAKRAICESVLDRLPAWFGIPEANRSYRDGVRDLPFIRVDDGDRTIGFASLKRNNEFVLEIHVMGIDADHHRKGIGRGLIRRVVEYAKGEGYTYLEVKTLDASRESEEYRRTRLFYRSVGFLPIDVLRNEWGEGNPCLIMLMNLA